MPLVDMAPTSRFEDVMTALCIAALAGAVMVAFLHGNPGRGADHYWRYTHTPTYWVMKMCQVVVIAAIAYNARFVLAYLYNCRFGARGASSSCA